MKEHEVTETLEVVEDYPFHQARIESADFRHTREGMVADKDVCLVCGKDSFQAHHGAVEWAFANGVDWVVVKGIATGAVKELRGVPVEKLLIYWLCKLAAARGFDWSAFDPTDPIPLIDGKFWMAPLCEEHHIGKDHGIHLMDFPHWIIQAFPLVEGFDLFQDAKNV